MLKLISSSCIRSRFHRSPPSAVQVDSHLLRILNSLRWRDANSRGTAFFCSDSSDGSDSDHLVEADDNTAEFFSDDAYSEASAIVSTNPRPEDYQSVSFRGFLMFRAFHGPCFCK